MRRTIGAATSDPSHEFSTVATMAIVAVLVVAPWVWWSSIEDGQFVPLSTNGPATVRAGLEVGGGRDE